MYKLKQHNDFKGKYNKIRLNVINNQKKKEKKRKKYVFEYVNLTFFLFHDICKIFDTVQNLTSQSL